VFLDFAGCLVELSRRARSTIRADQGLLGRIPLRFGATGRAVELLQGSDFTHNGELGRGASTGNDARPA
jgi:hypothetical protein